MDINYVGIGERIRSKRKELGITQNKLSEMIGLSEHYISKIERAVSKPRVDTLAAISKVLNISLDFLITGKTVNIENSETINKLLGTLYLMDEKDRIFISKFLEFYKNNKK